MWYYDHNTSSGSPTARLILQVIISSVLQMIELLSIRLQPVLELEPGSFGSAPSPPGPWDDEQGERYWNSCLAQSGLDNLNPVTPGDWHVALADVTTSSAIRTIALVHLAEEFEPVEEIPAHCGGFAVIQDTEYLLLPRCCGNLGDLENWQAAIVYREQTPQMLWIGHPWLSIRYADGQIHIREKQEYESPSEPREFVVSPLTLQHAVAEAEREVRLLLPKWTEVVAAIVGVRSPELTASRILGIAQ